MISLPRLLRQGSAVLVLLFVVWAAPATAQNAPAQPPSVSTSELEKLVGLLENEADRQRLIEQLKALIDAERRVAPEEPIIPERMAARFLGGLSDQLAAFGSSVLEAAAFITDAPKLYAWFEQQIKSEWSRSRLTEIFGKLALVLVAAWFAEWLTGNALAPTRRRLESREIGGGWARVPYVFLNAFLGLIPLVVFGFVGFGVLGFVTPSRTASLVVAALINANVIARAIALVSWTLLAPRVPRLRLVSLTDEGANYLYVWIHRLADVTVYGYFIAVAALLIGLPDASYVFLLKLLGLILALLLIIFILQNRVVVNQAILRGVRSGGPPSLLRRSLADLWHIAAILYVLTVCFIWLVRPDGGFEFVARATGETIVILLGAWVMAVLLRRFLGWAFRLSDEMRGRFPSLEPRVNRYLQIFNMVVLIAVYGFAALAVFQAWGFGSLTWLSTPFGRRVSASLVSMGITLVAALAIWEFVHALIDRYLARASTGSVHELRHAARVRTLLPLLQHVILGILGVFVVLIALSEIGVNIAPLLAGAGVVGIAVGFGAQTLAKDVISGVSVILEDSIAVGDVVRLGERSGVVEWMSLRSLRLRDGTGTVHWIPFGEVQIVSNLTKDFSYATFEIGVSYAADLDHAMAVMKRVGTELRTDPTIGPFIKDDLDMWGVDQLADSAVIIKARFRTSPGQQWPIKRAYHLRLKKAFDAEGIEIPFPQRTVHVVTEPKPGEAARPA